MGNGKVGIFCPAHHGDIALCTSVLKYKDILWPGKDVVWFSSLLPQFASRLDMFKHNDAISEVRESPPVTHEIKKFIDPMTGRLLLDRRGDFPGLDDIDVGYFPAPWAVRPHPKWDYVHYAEVPKQVFGVPPTWEWHPYLKFSAEEEEIARDFCAKLPYKRTIMLETATLSSGFQFSDDVIRSIMYTCRSKFKDCNFIFASKFDTKSLVADYFKFTDTGVVSASEFTVRQTALLHNHCDMFIGTCSGISMATSCWGNKPIPRVEYASGANQTKPIANGPVVSVIADNLDYVVGGRLLVQRIAETLDKYF